MRKLAIGIGIVLVLVVLLVLIVPQFIDVNQYRGTIQAQLEKRLNRPVTLGEMRLSLFPPSVKVNSFTIGDDPSFGKQKFAAAQELYVRPKIWPLLKQQIEISALELRQPQIELIRNAQGVWNFSTIGSTQAQQQQLQQPAGPEQQPTSEQQTEFSLDSLKISNGRVAVTDHQEGEPRAVYDNIDVTLSDFAPDKRFSMRAAAHLPGEGKQTVELRGSAGPINQSNLIQTPMTGTLRLNNVRLSGVQKYLDSPALSGIDAIVTGTTDINNDGGKLSSRGSITISEARVRGVEIGYPITADFRILNDLANNVINVEKGDLRLGSTPLSVTGTMNTKPTPAQMDMQMRASDVSVAEAARLASAFGVAFNPDTKVAGQVKADIQAKGAANQPALNGSLSARDVVVSGGDLPQPVKVQAVELALTPQQIRSNPFTAVSGSTNVAVQFTMSGYTSPSPNLDATLRTANAQVSELLSMAKASGVKSAEGMSGSGTLNLDVRATGPVKNTDAMTFNGTGALRNASLKSPTLTQPLQIRNTDIRFTSNSAVLSNIAASLGSTNATGNMTVRNFAAPNLQFTLNADKVNVAELQQITGGASGSSPQQRAGDTWSIVPFAHAQDARGGAGKAEPSMLPKMTGKGNLTVGTLQYDQLVMNNVRSGVTLNRGLLTLAPVTAQLYGGQQTGQITANLLATPMLVTVATKLNNVQANELLSAVSSIKNTLYGLLVANGDLRFGADSSSNVARSLNGTLALNLTNGRIAGIDLLNQLAAIGKFAGLRKSEQAMTNVAKLSGNFKIADGVAHTNNLQAVIDGGTLAAVGSVDLAKQALDMQMTAVLSRNVTQQAGSIGGLMTTALQNNRGETVIPVLVSGTFDNPKFAPDLQAVAQMKLNNLLPSVTNPGAGGVVGSILKGGAGAQGGQQGLGGIIGAITGGQQSPKQQQQGQPAQQQQQQQNQQQNQAGRQQQEPANAIGDLVNSIIGGKKKNQQQQQQQQTPPPR
ncbi:MAG TPA: AsmA family protein [Terriglobales bacterium]|nr:AsmA family protein [Terriglobales bacterium]